MKQTRRSGGLLFWALAALLLVAAVGRFAAGMCQLDDMRYAGDWNMSAGAIAAEAIDTPDWGEVFYDYYQVRFELTNHSQRPVDLDEYSFTATPEKGDEWAARFDEPWDSEAAYVLRPQIPQGCTGQVELVLRVDPDELEGNTLDLFFEDYAGGVFLGQFTLP